MEDIELFTEIMSAMFEEMFYREKDNGIAPDTIAVNFLFIEGVVNEQMPWEFDSIE